MDNISLNNGNYTYRKTNTVLLFILFFVEVIDNYLREIRVDYPILKYSILLIVLSICTLEYFSIIKKRPDRLKLLSAYKGISIICAFFLVLTIYFCIKNHGYTLYSIAALLKLLLPVFLSFVIANTVPDKNIYNILVKYLILSFIAYVLTIIKKFTITNFLTIDFIRSYSPFESNFFSPSAFALFLYFNYNNKKRWPVLLSGLFVILTFKRFMIVAMVVTLFLSRFVRNDKMIPALGIHLLESIVIIGTWGYMLVMEGALDEILIDKIGMSINKFTMGRGWLLENLKYNFTSYGFGSAVTQVRSIEMDFPLFYLEMGVLGVIVFVHFLYSMGNHKLYTINEQI